MKYTGQIKTADYQYLAFEMEGTAEEAVAAYKELERAYHGGEGLDPVEWNKLVDSYLENRTMEGDPGELQKLSRAQQWFVNELKKAFKRNNK